MTTSGQRRPRAELLGTPLTLKERDTLRWVAQGFAGAEIGKAPGIKSTYTIKCRLRSVYSKLGADNAAHAVFLAISIGWLDATTGLPNARPIPPLASQPVDVAAH